MKKKKKNSARLFGFRTFVFTLLALTTAFIMIYAVWGILLSLVLSLNNQNNISLMLTIISLVACVFLASRFTWINGNHLWVEWNSRQTSKQVEQMQENSSRLHDILPEAESDELDLQTGYEASTNS